MATGNLPEVTKRDEGFSRLGCDMESYGGHHPHQTQSGPRNDPVVKQLWME